MDVIEYFKSENRATGCRKSEKATGWLAGFSMIC